MSATPPTEELSPIKRALLEIRELRTRLADAEAAAREPIAVVGTGLRLPGGVRDLESLWTLLAEGRDAIGPIPADRWDVEALYDADPEAPGRMTTREGGFIDDVDCFDAEFFGISPREAESMDPQQRIVLETAWHALEDAGIAPGRLYGRKAGVFLGVCNNDYGRMLFAHRERIDPYFSTGNAGSVVSGRLAYFLGAQGPAVTLDTACSSSLVALHQAMQSLRAGECEIALAGGINLILSPEMNIDFSKANMMAADGRCKTFDAGADGYVRAEGCGIVVLRRLRDCTPSDRVLGVLRGSAINQDGRSSGLTAPNGPSQEAVVRAALAAAGVQAADVSYVEAHGTGTPLGDPIEVQALGAALCEGRDASTALAIGSIKTNLGHLEGAAGVAGLMKVLAMLRHGEIPPHLHLRQPSPHIDWEALPIRVPTVRTPWAGVGGRRIAGVSSFGFSGTNAHVIVEAPPAREPAGSQAPQAPQPVLALSARDEPSLEALCLAYAERLRQSSAPLADLCAAANTGRTHFAHRLALRADSAEAMAAGLQAAAAGGEPPADAQRGVAGAPPRIAFLFTGGGAQSVGMALGLYERSAVFRAALDRAAAVLDPLLGRPLLELLRSGEGDGAPIHQTRYGQPALVAVEIALAALWRSWGVEPAAVLGHSLGEYAAAHVAGVLSLEDALAIVVERTRCVDALDVQGGMATVFAPAAVVDAAIAQLGVPAVIAAYNTPQQVVVSGLNAAVDRVASHFEALGTRVSRLKVAYPSHSPLMEPVLARFERALAGVRFEPPRIAFVSNLSGGIADLSLVGRPAYWSQHLRQPVRFADSVRALHDAGFTHYLEIGPHPVLVGLGAECVPPGAGQWLPSLRRGQDDWSVMLDSLQSLYVAGATIDWAAVDGRRERAPVALPLYPFRRQRHWAEWARQAPAAGGDGQHAWQAVSDALARDAERAPVGLDLSGYEAKWAALARLTDAHAAAVLRGAGLFASAGACATLDEVQRSVGAADTYRHLIARWLQRLADAGLLHLRGAAYVAEQPLPAPALGTAWHEAEQLLADNRPLLDYVRHCGRLLPDVLAGRQSPLETLFPGGDFALADGLYRRSATMRYINGLAAGAVAAFVAARGCRPLRVIEIGAGTGGTTAALLPHLPAERTRYRFTDVSSFFFERAAQDFSAWPFLEFATLDIDRPLAEQQTPAGGFDLVVAANAVHASRDLRAAIARLRELVAPGGLLLLVESTVHLAWFDMTTGLIEGWQHFADDLRTDNPLLPAPTWIGALREGGFDEADAWPRPDSPAHAVGQHVIVACVGGEPGATVAAGQPGPAEAMGGPKAPVSDLASWQRRIADALPADRLDLLRDFVRERVMRILKLDAAHPPGPHDRLMDLGFDSLMAVQLRNQLGAGLQLDKPLPATLMFDHPTITALSAYLLQCMAPAAAAEAPAAPAPAPAVIAAEQVAAMTDAEIEALLLSRGNIT
ncbi:MAG: beta-ketoacyl synthase N-terminal-like domain-containing protein [Pseudomonadota bacterium]